MMHDTKALLHSVMEMYGNQPLPTDPSRHCYALHELSRELILHAKRLAFWYLPGYRSGICCDFVFHYHLDASVYSFLCIYILLLFFFVLDVRDL